MNARLFRSVNNKRRIYTYYFCLIYAENFEILMIKEGKYNH